MNNNTAIINDMAMLIEQLLGKKQPQRIKERLLKVQRIIPTIKEQKNG